MRLAEIEKKAKDLSIKHTWHLSRKDLIKMIQKAEGNVVCFGTPQGYCDQLGCCWRPDCIK